MIEIVKSFTISLNFYECSNDYFQFEFKKSSN